MHRNDFKIVAAEFLANRTKQKDNLVITRSEAIAGLSDFAMKITNIQVRDFASWLHTLEEHNEIGGRSYEALWHDFIDRQVNYSTAIGGTIEKD